MTGVDLNRNYGYHFGIDPADSDPCSETFRGPTPFSEPETQAIKSLVLSHPEIVSAMNFHSYGNLWIHPFNYLRKKNAYPRHLEPTVVNFYESFKEKIGLVSEADSGNAYDTVSYATDGEGSDWMLGERKIIAFSPELGTKQEDAQEFYPPKHIIGPALEENFKVVLTFLEMNGFKAKDLSYGFDQRGLFVLTFFQENLAIIFESDLVIEEAEGLFISGLSEVTVEARPGEVVKAKFEKSAENRRLKIEIPEIIKLQNFKILFKFGNAGEVSKRGFKADFTFKLGSGYEFWKLNVVAGGPRRLGMYHF